MGNRRVVSIVVAAVLAAAAAAGAFLLTAKNQAERVTKPVELSAPDLFPPETSMFLALHHADRDWAAFDDLRRRIEPTATWKVLSEQFLGAEGGQGGMPAGGAGSAMLATIRKAQSEVETRLGRKPDSREFFETFGRATALGMVPGQGDAPTRMLLVTRLPDETAASGLKDRFALTPAMKRREPAPAHGYPVFVEDRGEGKSLHFGVGGGFLFLADDQAVLDGALDRLKGIVDGAVAGAPRPASLSADATFRKGMPGKWEDVRYAFFLKKDHRLEKYDPALAPVGAVLAHAFVLDPAAPAVALSAGDEAGVRSFHASWQTGAAAGWEDLLPGGACVASVPRDEPAGAREKAYGADLARMRGKALWAEIRSLARDTPRLKRILGEAMPPGSVPPDDVLARIPNDVELLGAVGGGVLEALFVGEAQRFAYAQKVYRGDFGVSTETGFVVRLDPAEALALASLLDMGVEAAPEILLRGGAPGALAWSVDLKKMIGEIPGLTAMLHSYEPGLVLGRGAAWLTLGPGMRADILALAAGTGATLGADPLYREALGVLEPGAVSVDFQRPGEILKAAVQEMQAGLDTAMESMEAPEENGKLLAALGTTLQMAAGWADGIRFSVTGSYLDPARPSVATLVMDPAASAASPRISMGNAALRVPGILPATTFLLADVRMDAGPASAALAAKFLGALPEGRAHWDRTLDGTGERKNIEDILDVLAAGIRGEAGVAMMSPGPLPAPEGPPGTGAIMDRIPGLVMFASYADAGKAFEVASGLLKRIHEEASGTMEPFEDQVAAYEAGEGGQPWGLGFEVSGTGEKTAAALHVFTAPEPGGAGRPTFTVGVQRRGNLLILAVGEAAFKSVATNEEGAPGTLAARMAAELPGEFLPAEAAAAAVVREDGLSDVLGPFCDMLLPFGPQLTLSGLGGPPPEDRLKAHQDGWKKGIDLLKDALRTSTWHGWGTRQEGERWVTIHRRATGK